LWQCSWIHVDGEKGKKATSEMYEELNKKFLEIYADTRSYAMCRPVESVVFDCGVEIELKGMSDDEI
jgi:hypothetical protein